jgi:hypothetical protein
MDLESLNLETKVTIHGFNDVTPFLQDFFYEIKDESFIGMWEVPGFNDTRIIDYLNNAKSYSSKEYFIDNLYELYDYKINKAVLESIHVLKDKFWLALPIGCSANTRFDRSIAITKNVLFYMKHLAPHNFLIFTGEPHMEFIKYFASEKYGHESVSSVNHSQFKTHLDIVKTDISNALGLV